MAMVSSLMEIWVALLFLEHSMNTKFWLNQEEPIMVIILNQEISSLQKPESC